MVTMVYPREQGLDPRIARAIHYFREREALFTGPRSFSLWHWAVAYALLPADPNITTAPRRRVRKGVSGRWLVKQSFAHPPGCVHCSVQRDPRGPRA